MKKNNRIVFGGEGREYVGKNNEKNINKKGHKGDIVLIKFHWLEHDHD